MTSSYNFLGRMGSLDWTEEIRVVETWKAAGSQDNGQLRSSIGVPLGYGERPGWFIRIVVLGSTTGGSSNNISSLRMKKKEANHKSHKPTLT